MKVTICYKTQIQKNPTLHTLNEIMLYDSSPINDQVENNKKQTDPNRDSRGSFRTVHSNLGPVGHSNKLPGLTTVAHKKQTRWYR